MPQEHGAREQRLRTHRRRRADRVRVVEAPPRGGRAATKTGPTKKRRRSGTVRGFLFSASATAAPLLLLLLLLLPPPPSSAALPPPIRRPSIAGDRRSMQSAAGRGVAFALNRARNAPSSRTTAPSFLVEGGGGVVAASRSASTRPRRRPFARLPPPPSRIGRTEEARFLSALPDAPPPVPPPPPPPPLEEKDKEKEVRSVLPPSEEAAFVAEIMSTPDRSLYEKLVRRLYMTNLFHPVKMGLNNIEDLHAALGSPMDDPSICIIHIAGTNGKGSVALKTARSLELAGNGNNQRVGLFASPHVSSFRERMSVNGVPISEREVERLLPRVFGACEERDIPATFFEVTTALAFLYFAESGCDAVVLETGLGGRLDATNVVRSPALCVITSIGLEHTRILGDTVEQIAREKGGIIKRGRPVLVGPHCPHGVLRACAEERGADGYFTCNDVLGETEPEPEAEAEGEEGAAVDYDEENARIATAALELLRRQQTDENGRLALPSPEQIRKGTSLRPPCRFEQVRVRVGEDGPKLLSNGPNDREDDGNSGGGDDAAVTVVLDVAHNPDAMRYLVSKLESAFPGRPKRIVAGFSSDKDLRSCGDALLSGALGDDPSRLHLVEAAHPRAARLEDILDANPALRESSNFDDVGDRSISAQVRSALRLSAEAKAADAGEDEVLVVCGSVFLMAEAREALGYDEPRDSEYVAEVAGCNLRHGQENFGNVDPEKKRPARARA